MSFWPILLIGLAIAMAVGPIMLMQPSNRDKRLANLRQKAALAGLHVRMSNYDKGDQKITVAVYSCNVNLPKNTPSWSLLRRSYRHEIHFYGVWEWQTDKRLESKKFDDLRGFLDKISNDIVGIEVNEKSVSLWWKENPSEITVEYIKDLLEELAAIAG